MESYVEMYTAMYRGLVKDLLAAYPPLATEFEKDFLRLSSSISSEGIGFITLTHGEIEGAFLMALSRKEDLALMPRPRGYGRKSKDDARPKYLFGLHSLVFNADGSLRDDIDPNAVFFIRQWLSLAKKAALNCTEERNASTLQEWVSIESRLPDHHPGTWDNLVPSFADRSGHPLWGENYFVNRLPGMESSDDAVPELFWNYARRFTRRVISSFEPINIFDIKPKHGPGAVAEGKIVKYEFPNWPAKLDALFPWDWFATHDLGYYGLENQKYPRSYELASLMYAVPKTQKGPRLIAAEPTAHQWIQGGVQRWLEEQVHRGQLMGFINFRDQRLSQDMVLSCSTDGGLSTIDLSSASDRLSTRLVEWVFQAHPPLLEVMHSCRTQYCRLPDGVYHRLKKFSTQGSALTFPVQSIVFTILALAATSYKRWGEEGIGRWRELEGAVRVFGDDIIVPTEEYQYVCDVLHSAGLKVNQSKSFSTGLFRESCGMDAFMGVNVTPIRVKMPYIVSQPESLASVVDAASNLHIAGLWFTSKALVETVPVAIRNRIFIGWQGSGALSLHSFVGSRRYSTKWNPDYHYWESPGIGLISKATIQKGEGTSGLIQFFTEEPDPYSSYESGRVGRVKTAIKRRRYAAPLD